MVYGPLILVYRKLVAWMYAIIGETCESIMSSFLRKFAEIFVWVSAIEITYCLRGLPKRDSASKEILHIYDLKNGRLFITNKI